MRSLTVLFLVGCYASHGLEGAADAPLSDASRRDAPDSPAAGPCLADGVYEVTAVIGESEPPGCFGGPGMAAFTVHVPPIEDDYRGMCGAEAVSIVPTDVPCTWEILADCPAPDASTRVSGTFSASTRGPSARFTVEQGSLFGVCRFPMTFEPAP